MDVTHGKGQRNDVLRKQAYAHLGSLLHQYPTSSTSSKNINAFTQISTYKQHRYQKLSYVYVCF
jgi:hypothetical protein